MSKFPMRRYVRIVQVMPNRMLRRAESDD